MEILDLNNNRYDLDNLSIKDLAKLIFENTSIFATDDIFKKSKIGVGEIKFKRKIEDVTDCDEDCPYDIYCYTIGKCEINNLEVLLKIDGKQLEPMKAYAEIEIQYFVTKEDATWDDPGYYDEEFDRIRIFNFEEFYVDFVEKLTELGVLKSEEQEDELLDELNKYLESFSYFAEDEEEFTNIMNLDPDHCNKCIERISNKIPM